MFTFAEFASEILQLFVEKYYLQIFSTFRGDTAWYEKLHYDLFLVIKGVVNA